MHMKLEFENGEAKLTITPSDEWERKMLCAVAKGGDALEAEAYYKSEGHLSYGECKCVALKIRAPAQKSDE